MDPQVGQALDGLSFSLCFTLCLHISSYQYCVHPSKKHIHILVFFLLRLHVVCELYLGILSFWTTIQLSVSAYHVWLGYLTWMAKKHLKKCKSKQHWDSTSHQSEWLRWTTQGTTDTGLDVEKEEHSSIAGGIASLYNHSGNQFGSSSENYK